MKKPLLTTSNRDFRILLNRFSESKCFVNEIQSNKVCSKHRSYEFDVTIPHQSLLRIQVWDWDLANVNDKIAETRIDIENRWFSCHRATCGLAKRYDRSIRRANH